MINDNKKVLFCFSQGECGIEEGGWKFFAALSKNSESKWL